LKRLRFSFRTSAKRAFIFKLSAVPEAAGARSILDEKAAIPGRGGPDMIERVARETNQRAFAAGYGTNAGMRGSIRLQSLTLIKPRDSQEAAAQGGSSRPASARGVGTG
jgi:hypothetical protein